MEVGPRWYAACGVLSINSMVLHVTLVYTECGVKSSTHVLRQESVLV